MAPPLPNHRCQRRLGIGEIVEMVAPTAVALAVVIVLVLLFMSGWHGGTP